MSNINLIIVLLTLPWLCLGNFDLDEYINPEDLEIFSSTWISTTVLPTIQNDVDIKDHNKKKLTHLTDNIYYYNVSIPTNGSQEIPESVDCFGLGSIMSKLRWVLNLKPQESSELNVEFYFSNRKKRYRMQVIPGDQFGLEWVSYDPSKPTILIVHGFLSYSKASWVLNMTAAFLDWGDVNVITVDWSRGGKTWKYWRAVANTRTVGSDIANFLQQLVNETGANIKDFHFVGHSLGAHICSFASNKLGRVRRITGLDPAQPCFITTDLNNLLDKSDADFVDVIHTNGRKIINLGLGVPNTCGHQDFYPNGGMKQPGCLRTGKRSFISKYIPISQEKLERAMCNHGRAYLLFTESLKGHNCSLIGHKWNLSYKGVNASLDIPCTNETCSELGIRSNLSPARGSFYVVTSATRPFCFKTPFKMEIRHALLSDILKDEAASTTTATITTTTITTEYENVTEKSSAKSKWFSWFRKSN